MVLSMIQCGVLCHVIYIRCFCGGARWRVRDMSGSVVKVQYFNLWKFSFPCTRPLCAHVHTYTQIRERFDSGQDVELTNHNPHDVACLLKEFFRSLPEPLLTRELYQPFLATRSKRHSSWSCKMSIIAACAAWDKLMQYTVTWGKLFNWR